jgi:hypothetical protein
MTLDKNIKRARTQGREELSENKKHHVTEESNKSGNFTKILRSSRTLVDEAQEDNISVLPRRSTRLVFKVIYPLFFIFRGGVTCLDIPVPSL